MKIYYKNWRLFLIFLFLFLSIAAIVSRMVYVQVEQGNFLLQKGNNQNTSERVIKFKRGSIYDKNGIPLAISITGFDLFALSGLREDDFLKIKKDLLNHGRFAAAIEIKSSSQINTTSSPLLLMH